ncbi:MAG: hypothetical protein ABII85_01735 [Bacillota bacterium]
MKTFVTERDITLALKMRHNRRGDYFASQVKMGSAGNKILDAIAIPITWSPITIIGYEIKVSRADFMNDQKYPHYMSTCNLFYFVVPKGLIEKDEVPLTVGIIEYNNGNLRQIKKPLYRKVEINTDMLLHCIFYQVHQYNRPKTRQEYLDDVKAKVESKNYGNKISEKIKELERRLTREGIEEDQWKLFEKEFERKFGFKPYRWNIFQYISIDNKKHNEALELLQRAAKLFSKEDPF